MAFLLLLFLIGYQTSHAQIQRYSFHQLNPDNGLSQASNDHIYQDSKGFIWLSSLDGLNRFDGKEVKVYKSIAQDSTSLLGNIITSSFFEDRSANLWFTSYEGLHCYLRDKDHFLHFQLEDEQGDKLVQDYHCFHLDDAGQLWLRIGIGDKGRLYLFDIHNYSQKMHGPLDGQRNFPVLDQEARVEALASCIFSGRLGLEITSLDKTLTKKIFFNQSPQTRVYHINTQAQNSWYLGTDLGLILFHPDQETYQIIDQYQGQSIGSVRASLDIDEQTLWVASQEQGLLVFDKGIRDFVAKIPYEPTEKLGLQLKAVNKIHLDQQDNVWLSSTTAGVNYASLNKRKFSSLEALKGESIGAIFESSEQAIFCSLSNGEIAYFSDSRSDVDYAEIQMPEGIPSRRFLHFFEDNKSNVWGISGRNLFLWKPSTKQFIFQDKLPAYCLYAFQDGKRDIIIATYAGIYKWQSNSDGFQILPFSTLGPYQQSLATAVYQDAARNLYLALDASRLVILQPEGEQYREVKSINGIGYAKGFWQDSAFVWVATSTGILQINPKEWSTKLLNAQEDGAPDGSFYSILQDKNGTFWLSSNQGVFAYDPASKTHRRFSLADGIQGNEYNTNAYLQTSDGEIWFGGPNGLNRFYPDKIQDIPSGLSPQLTKLLVNDEIYPLEQQIGELAAIDLPFRENTISFEFVGFDYADPAAVQFQYQLENHEDHWVNAGTNGFARYSSLPPGNYRFKVKASNSDGIWSDSIRSINILIRRPWWRSWWFYLACVLIPGIIIYGLLTYRLQQALKLERMRVRISSDLHDDVGGLLSGLAMQTEILELTAQEDRKAKLQRISEMSRSAMSRMRDTVWAIDARKDKLENLLDRIREHAAETLEPKGIAFNLDVNGLALDRNMPSRIRQNLYLICKEAITNTAKYSNGDHMTIQFTKLAKTGLQLNIHDNGNVPEKGVKSTGLGLSNMQMRAEQIGANISIERDNGFRINLSMSSQRKI